MSKKLTFFYPPGQDSFLKDIIKDARTYEDFKVDTFDLTPLMQKMQNPSMGDDQYYYRVWRSSDVCWFEWGHDIMKFITKGPKYNKHIMRIHSYEVFNGIQHQINWDNIDKVVVVNDSIKEIIQKGIQGSIQGTGVPDEKIEVIYNGVDVDKFLIPKDKKFNKKVAYVGYLNHKKDPALLLQVFQAIHDYDNEFTFHIAGQHQDPRFIVYLKHISQYLDFPIYFDGWQRDVPKYLEDKDFVVSSSIFESFQMSMMEGMAQGVVPLVNNWFGASNIYKKEHIWTGIKDCVDIVDSFVKCEDKKSYRQGLRDYVVNNFSLNMQLKEISDLIHEVADGR